MRILQSASLLLLALCLCASCARTEGHMEVIDQESGGPGYAPKPKPAPKDDTKKGKVWVCKICGYEYDEEEEGVPFAELPEDWVCPLCKHPKSDFELK